MPTEPLPFARAHRRACESSPLAQTRGGERMITCGDLVDEEVRVRVGDIESQRWFLVGARGAQTAENRTGIQYEATRGETREKSQTECSGREPLCVPRRAPVLIEWPRLEDGSGWVESSTRHGSTQLRGRRGWEKRRQARGKSGLKPGLETNPESARADRRRVRL